jgi:hypothetical protein
LTLNFDKTYYIQFLTKNSDALDMHIEYGDAQIAKSTNTKFLGLIVDSMLSWKEHVKRLMSKLRSACYGNVKPYMLQEIIRMVYFSYFYSVMTYDIIFWGNSPHSILIFRLQKGVIRIITNSRSRVSCRELLNNWKSCPSNHSIYFLFHYLWLKTENNLTLTLRFMASIRDTITIVIIQYVI